MSRAPFVLPLTACLLAATGCPGDDGEQGESSSGVSATTGSTGEPTTTGVQTDPAATEAESSTGLPPDTNIEACEGATMRPKPNDTSERGPWPVGASTVTIGNLTVEVFYPAVPGSEVGVAPVVYDIRESLPPAEGAKIGDDVNPPLDCDCARDLPIDETFGPYPAIVFVHGTAGFRTQSLRHLTHWASRGFVVLAADHPGLQLADLLVLAPGCGTGESPPPRALLSDVEAMVAAVRGQTGELAAFTPSIDASRLGATGHSAGGSAVGPLGNLANVIVPLAAGPEVTAGSALQSTLIMGGDGDTVVPYTSVVDGYESSAGPKRLVGIAGAGHLAFSEICSVANDTGANVIEIATDAGVCGIQFANALFQCGDELTPDPDSWEIIEYATAAAFEETLHCSPTVAANLEAIEGRFPLVVESRSE